MTAFLHPFAHDEVTVISRIPAKHGDYKDGARTVYPHCSVQPTGSSEQRDFSEQVTNRYRLIAPFDFLAKASDVVTVDTFPGRRFHLDGAVTYWRDRSARGIYAEANIYEVEG